VVFVGAGIIAHFTPILQLVYTSRAERTREKPNKTRGKRVCKKIEKKFKNPLAWYTTIWYNVGAPPKWGSDNQQQEGQRQ
jgi:hypothetical protein